MPRTASTALALPSPAALPPLPRLLVSAALVLARWEDRRRSRLALERLTPQQLRDIGLTPGAAEAEAARPFWRC